MVPLSVLDLAPIVQGADASQALHNSRDLAVHAERWGYRRYWLAEHHNMPGIASAATAVVIGHVAAATFRIRVGAGGIMLPNHAPLVIAEQFGTLAALFPGRVDLGVGRAPGTDPRTAHALRRTLSGDVDAFADDVQELLSYFKPWSQAKPVQAVPGAGADIEAWILGSSLYGAQLAAELGLPYAFASHFAPAHMHDAIKIYRASFRPSARLAKPHVMLGVTAVVADTDAEAQVLSTSLEQAFVALRFGRPVTLPPPRAGFGETLQPHERAMLDERLTCAFIGAPATVREGLERFVEQTQADELVVTAQIFDHQARLRSYELLARLQ